MSMSGHKIDQLLSPLYVTKSLEVEQETCRAGLELERESQFASKLCSATNQLLNLLCVADPVSLVRLVTLRNELELRLRLFSGTP